MARRKFAAKVGAASNLNVATSTSKVVGGDVTTTRKGGETTAVSRTAIDKAVLESISSLLSEAKGLYAPEGDYMAGIEAQLGRGRTRAVAGGMQGLAAAGLASTSMAGGLARKYEEEVAAPTMAQATTQRLTALAGLAQTEAGFQAQLAPRETTQKTTTSPMTTEQVTTPRTTTQRTTSPAIPVRGGGGGPTSGGGGAAPARPSSGSAPRPQPLPPDPGAAVLKNLGLTKKEPTGYQGVFFGADFYKQQQAKTAPAPAPVRNVLSSFYGGSFEPPAPATPSLMQQADRYNLSGRYF